MTAGAVVPIVATLMMHMIHANCTDHLPVSPIVVGCII